MDALYTLFSAPEHRLDDHPEHPDRFSQFPPWQSGPLARCLTRLKITPAAEEDLLRVHKPELLRTLKAACEVGGFVDYAPTYVSPASWQAALTSAGGALTVSRAILSGACPRGFALTRPPGHHAEPGHAMGFCLFNNVAIAAADALARGLERAAIFDFDVHHGNGTQAAFLNHPQVGFFSTHEEHIYPGSGAIDEAPHARGRLLNLPLPAGAGDRAFEQIMQTVLAPWLAAWQPQMLFVSAGFDAHWRDPLAHLGLSTSGYFRMAQALISLADRHCGGRILFVLEGGYDPEALAHNTNAVMQALAGQSSAPDPLGPGPEEEPDINPRLERLKTLHHL